MTDSSPAQWQLPHGVSRGLWDYFQSPDIAGQYDAYFAENSLFAFDEAVLSRYFTKPGLIADLGCGTGRALVPLVRQGHQGLAIDLSPHMLDIVAKKARDERLPIECLQANLVELDVLADRSVDYCVCMFSTLGMISGRENRRRALVHARRILRPGGLLVLHVHNLWYNLFDPGGRWWLLRNAVRSTLRRNVELGDKFFSYRGIPNMFLHVFRRPELRHAIEEAGFEIQEMIALDTARRHALPRAWLFGRLRANGWIVVCRKPDEITLADES